MNHELPRLRLCPSCGINLERVEPDAAVGDLTISLWGDCYWRGQRVKITKAETAIVHALASAKGAFLTAEALENITGTTAEWPVITVFMHRIRKAFIAIDPSFNRLETGRGRGYRWALNPGVLQEAPV